MAAGGDVYREFETDFLSSYKYTYLLVSVRSSMYLHVHPPCYMHPCHKHPLQHATPSTLLHLNNCVPFPTTILPTRNSRNLNPLPQPSRPPYVTRIRIRGWRQAGRLDDRQGAGMSPGDEGDGEGGRLQARREKERRQRVGLKDGELVKGGGRKP